ncbi:hypothetical protein ACWIUD_01330 [Helicobacter sp. 23-1044]
MVFVIILLIAGGIWWLVSLNIKYNATRTEEAFLMADMTTGKNVSQAFIIGCIEITAKHRERYKYNSVFSIFDEQSFVKNAYNIADILLDKVRIWTIDKYGKDTYNSIIDSWKRNGNHKLAGQYILDGIREILNQCEAHRTCDMYKVNGLVFDTYNKIVKQIYNDYLTSH